MAIEQVPKEQEVAHGATINLDADKTLCWAGGPHFCTRFRGQIDAGGPSSPRGDSFRCFARVCRRILGRNVSRKRMNKVKTVRITLCTFRTATSSSNARPREFILKRFPTTTSAKVTAQNRANRAGGPHYLAVNPSKSFVWVAPACCKHQCHDKSVINQAVAPLEPCPSRTREKDRIP